MTATASLLTDEQKALRKNRLGASEFAAALGVDARRSPIDLWLEKTGRTEFTGNEFTEWGNRLEGVVARAYQERMHCKIRRETTLIHPKYPWIVATPDRRVWPLELHEGLEERWGLECKNRNHFDWWKWGVPGSDEIPDEVNVQSQINMSVTRLKRWDVAVLLGGNRLGIYTVRYDKELVESLIEGGHEFLHEYVLRDIQPPLDASQAAADWMERKWSLQGESMLEATPEQNVLVGALRFERRLGKENANEQKALTNQLKDIIGQHAGLLLPDGLQITWKRPKAQTATDWEAVTKLLRLGAEVDDHVFRELVGIHTEEISTTNWELVAQGLYRTFEENGGVVHGDDTCECGAMDWHNGVDEHGKEFVHCTECERVHPESAQLIVERDMTPEQRRVALIQRHTKPVKKNPRRFVVPQKWDREDKE